MGSTACAACAAGTYSSGEGNSDCLPCDVGTYQSAAGAAACLACPTDSYARLPGAATCVRCAAGRASACTQASCSGAAPSAGYHVATISSLGSLSSPVCAVVGWGSAVAEWAPRPPLLETCTVSSATRLSFFVRADCAVDVYALGDAACSDPSASARPVLSGFYTSPTQIRSGLGTSGSVLKLAARSTTSVTLALYTATTDPTRQFDAGASCGGILTVTGGQVAGASRPSCPQAPCATAPGPPSAASHARQAHSAAPPTAPPPLPAPLVCGAAIATVFLEGPRALCVACAGDGRAARPS